MENDNTYQYILHVVSFHILLLQGDKMSVELGWHADAQGVNILNMLHILQQNLMHISLKF